MLDGAFDNLLNEVVGALADSHKEYIIASIIETASLTGEIDIIIVKFIYLDDAYSIVANYEEKLK